MTKPKKKQVPLVELNNISRSFDTADGVIPVLQNINLSVRPIDKLTGRAEFRTQLDNGATVKEVMHGWDANTFRQQREPYLIYKNERSS